ncbi:MAG: hypothetical protein ACOY3N_09065 [Bradyrhizobium sp.]|uniref:hypothetical protein n=1 Tax=Bradyrhizobium sp. TaxID=376 RepID=UPI003BEFA43E
MPTTGYDRKDVEKEIARLVALNDASYETQLLIRAMKLALKAEILEGFCEFVGDAEDPFLHKDPVPDQLIEALYEKIYGPPRPGFIPMLSSSSVKGLGDYSGPSLIMPGDLHYIARAMIHSGRTGVPLINDVPGLQLPGVPTTPVNDAKLLASILAVECTRIALPAVPLLRPEDLMEFRDASAALLRAFRRSMLRYAADLNGKIKGMDREEFEKQTQFFIQTQIVPAMDELDVTLNDPARPWHKRAVDAVKIVPEIAGAYLAGGSSAALTKALTSVAAQFFVEVAAKGDKEEALKRSGLTYLLRLKTFHAGKV